jgi:glycosyl transferase family 2
METDAFSFRLQANGPEGQKRFPISKSPRRRSLGWVNFVGRITLWTVSGSLLFLALAGVSSTLWLLVPLTETDWFLALHRFFLAGALVCTVAALVILFLIHRFLVPPRDSDYRSLDGARVHVGLTAYNDEVCIAEAVREFKACQEAARVIVVENNSRDRTFAEARQAGADAVFTEVAPGYGACCRRALDETAQGADVIVLCEGDLTFTARDMKKLLAYLENCDLVLGTRATQELRESGTQMDWLINPFNQIVAKLIQVRFWGTRLTDVGCTYRALRIEAYHRLRGTLWVCGNHFSPHMFIQALKLGMRVIEVPIVFRRRGGESKGVGSNKVKAARVAVRMLGLIYTA